MAAAVICGFKYDGVHPCEREAVGLASCMDGVPCCDQCILGTGLQLIKFPEGWPEQPIDWDNAEYV